MLTSRAERRRQEKLARKKGKSGGAAAQAIAALLARGEISLKSGQWDQAYDLFGQVLAVRPAHRAALPNAAMAAMNMGLSAEAADLLERAMVVTPKQRGLAFNLANMRRNMGQTREAITAYEMALVIDPDYVDAYINLGSVLRETGEFGRALKILQRAAKVAPGNFLVLNNLGNACLEFNRADEAVTMYQKAIKLNPNPAYLYRNLGVAWSALGNSDQAVLSFRNALERDSSYSEVYRFLVNEGVDFVSGGDISAMERLLAEPEPDTGGDGTDQAARVNLHFALAKVCDHRDDRDAAYEHWRTGNGIHRASLDYDVANDERLMADIASQFGPTRFMECAGVGNPSDVPIFILGMPRSGTSLVEQILASHPVVHGAGERNDLGRVMRQWDQIATADGFARIGDDYLRSLREIAPDATRITDKMPLNFLHIGPIALALPNARIIHVSRDPLDTCLSAFQLLFTTAQEFSYSLTDLGRYYRAYERLMDHWRGVLPGRILEVRYEDLVADTQTQTRRMVSHCGLEWDDQCLRHYETNRAVVTASAGQANLPVYQSSVQRWKRFETHLEPLIKALAR